MARSMRAPLLALAAALTAVPLAAQPYAQEINTWVAQDLLDPPPENALLFVGSSSVRRWEKCSFDFSPYDVIQRGFGGSTFGALNQWVDEIVLAYDPAAIIVFEGTNDVASGLTANQVFADYLTFVNLVRTGQSQTRPPIPIFFLGITPTPSRWALWPISSQVNTLVEAHTQGDPSLHYVDIPSAFLATGSPPASSLFVADQLHLSASGYALWSSVIQPAVAAVVPPTKNYRRNPLHPAAGTQLLFDFGPSDGTNGNQTVGPDANGNYWNNWHAVAGSIAINAGEHIGNLLSTGNAHTGIGMVVTGGFAANGILNGGLLGPSPALLGPLAVANATQDYFFSDDEDRPGGFMLTGLDRALGYDLRLFGSRATSEVRVTGYEAEGRCGTRFEALGTSGPGIGSNGVYNGNDDDVAELKGLRPDRFGRLFVDVQRLAASWAYVNAMQLVVGTPPACDTEDRCAGVLRLPHAVAGEPWPVQVSGLRPHAGVALLVGTGPIDQSRIGPCVLQLDPGDPERMVGVLHGMTDATGAWSGTLRVPHGVEVLAIQAVSLGSAETFAFSRSRRVPVVR